MAHIQSDAVQLALDLLVREPDITGFFRAFIKTLVEESESHACGVWLLDHDGTQCDLWMAYIDGRFVTKESHDWDALTLPRASVAAHLLAQKQGWTETIEYGGDDSRLPEPVQAFNRASGIESLVIAPLVLLDPQPGMGRPLHRIDVGLREPLAPGAGRSDGAAGHARAASEPAGRAEPRRGAAAGGARRAQPDGARHPRHAGAGIRRDPDAAAGGAALDRRAAARGGEEPRDRRRPGADAHDRRPPLGVRAPARSRPRARMSRPRSCA